MRAGIEVGGVNRDQWSSQAQGLDQTGAQADRRDQGRRRTCGRGAARRSAEILTNFVGGAARDPRPRLPATP